MPRSSADLLYSAIQLASYTTVPGVFFGINFCLYILCARLSYQQYRETSDSGRKQTLYSFVYTSIIVLCVAWELGSYGRIVQEGIIGHRVLVSTSELLVNYVPALLIDVLIPATQLWRTWVIWTGSPYALVVTIMPLLIQVANIALTIWGITIPTFNHPENLNKWYALARATEALDFTFTVLITILLVGRILGARKRLVRLMGTRSESPYTSIIAMLVESYALEAVWSSTVLITYVIGEEAILVSVIVSDQGNQVKVIAYLLLYYRVLLGRAWTRETEQQLSTLRWNHETRTQSDMGDILSSTTTTRGKTSTLTAVNSTATGLRIV